MAKGSYKSNFNIKDIKPIDWVMVKSAISAFRGGAGNFTDDDLDTKPFPDLGFEDDIILVDIIGDSMEPELLDGNTIVIEQKKNYVPKNGEIIAVYLNGDSIIKVWDIGAYHVMLSSINPNHEPIRVNSDDTLQVIGKVIWSCKPINKK